MNRNPRRLLPSLSRISSVYTISLSGMTGTALTEEAEFREIYKLDVIEIPTNKPMIRKDYEDVSIQDRKSEIQCSN